MQGTPNPKSDLANTDIVDTANEPGDGIYTDGSCIGNPGPGGCAFVRVQGGEVVFREGGCDADITNNRMESMAAIAAMNSVGVDENVTIYTDRSLVAKTLNEYAQTWERRGWTRKGPPLKNLDLVKSAWALKQARPGVEIVWIKGHSGIWWNTLVDLFARGEAPKAQPAQG